MVTSVRSDKQEAVLGVNPEGKEVKAKALEALHPFPEGAPGEDSNDVTKSRSNLVRMNKGAGKIKQKPRHVSQVGAQPRGLTRSQTKASTRKVESPNRTGSSVLETLKCHPELQRLKFHKIKQDPLESSTTTFTSLPANSDVMDSSIQSKQPRTAEGVSCSHFESDLNKISQTQSEPSIALVVEGSEEFDTVDSRARTGQLGPTKAAATTNAGEPITETITGEQEQLSTNGEAISMYASENVLNLGPKVHPKAGNTKIQSSWVSRDGIDPKLTRSQLSKRTQQVELSNQTGNPGFVPKKHTDSKQHNFKRDQSEPSTTAVAKVPTGSNAVEINIEPNTIEGPPCTQSELKISALDDTPQTQSGTSIVVPVVEASWGRPTENLSSRTSKVHQKAGDTTIHQVWRVTRSQTKKSTQRFDFSNQSGYSNVEVPKNRTDLKHFKFTKIKKDQPEPNTMTAVAGGRKPVDINMNLRKEELSCAQEESNLPELDDTWQTQSETSIAPVAEASVDSNMERSTIKEFSLPRTQSVSNFSELNDTRQTQSETSMVLVAAVSQVHLTENSPSHVLKVSEKARNVMIKPGGVNPMETRIKNSTQRSEPSNPTGNSVEVPKKRTGWKRQFKEIKKDQPEPSTTTTVLTGSNAIDFNVDSSTNGESQCAQPNRKILELNDTRQSQSDTSIIAHTDSSAVGSNAETSQLVAMKVAPTHEGGLDAETTLPNQQVGNQTSPKHKRKKPPEEQMAAILTVGISQEAETPRKRARRKKVENSDEATELAKEVSPKAVKMPKEQKTKLVKEPKVKSLSTPKAKRVKSFRINLRSILAGKSRPTRGEPQWKLPKLQPLGVSDDALVTVAERSDMQPSIWCSSKEELVSALPELSLTMNGIAWLLSTTPVIFLEDPSSEMAVSNLVSDGLSFELKMTRDFVCLSTDLALPAEPVVNAMPAESVVNISAIKLPSNVNTCGGASYDRTDAQAFNDASSESQNPYTFSQPPHGGLPSRDGSIAENPGPRGFDVEFSVRPPPNGLPPILPSRVPTCTPYAYPFSVACQTQEHFRFNPGITDHTFTNTYRKSPSHGSQQKIACPPAENYLELHRPLRIASPSKVIPSTVNSPPYSWPNAPVYPPINAPAMNIPSRSSNSSSRTMNYSSNSSEAIADPSIYCPNPYNGALLPTRDEWNSSAQMNAMCRDYGHTGTTDGRPTSTVNVEKKGKGKQRMTEDSSVEMGRKPKRARTTRMNNGPLDLSSPTSDPVKNSNPGMQYGEQHTSYSAPPNVLTVHSGEIQNNTEKRSVVGRAETETSSIPPSSSSVSHIASEPGIDTYTHPDVQLPSAPPVLLNSDPVITVPISTSSTPSTPPTITLSRPASENAEPPSPHPEPASSASVSGGGPGLGGVDQRIPSKLPPEIVALCETYVACTPVTVIASRAFMERRWGVSVPEECGYVYLGFFVIDGVQERRVEMLEQEKEEKKRGRRRTEVVEEGEEFVSGRMEWWFKCRWVPSGEEVEAQPEGNVVRPWWSPSPSLNGSSSSPTVPHAPSVPNTTRPSTVLDTSTNSTTTDLTSTAPTDTPTTPRYLTRRCEHPNHKLLIEDKLPLHWAYHHLLPPALRGGEAGDVDGDLPNGWWCRRCGRVNFRRFLRGGRCVGCVGARGRGVGRGAGGDGGEERGEEGERGEGEIQGGYAVELAQLRDPQQNGVLSHPANLFPEMMGVDGERTEWGDGMVCFEYFWDVVVRAVESVGKKTRKGKEKEKAREVEVDVKMQGEEVVLEMNNNKSKGKERVRNVSVLHVFTGNDRVLQRDATALLRDVQIRVPLERQMCSTNPYFTYTTSTPSMENGESEWLPTVVRAKEVMCARARVYAEREVKVGRVDVCAWVVGGKRKVPTPLDATRNPVVLMLLGCEVEVTIIPRSGFPNSQPSEIRDGPLDVGTSSGAGVEASVDVNMGECGEMRLLEPGEGVSVFGESAVINPVEEVDKIMDGGDVDIGNAGVPAKKAGRKPGKTEKQAVIVTLVHGDVLVLSGDVFEYSLKRAGTSILMTGTS
ncbi:hypothetical protein H2248_011116 [Termitomyces sp. 'cryptogamus']|nr:hypothetical protein H2248_011116 [Termitomyces sp. 'cryptogamus']